VLGYLPAALVTDKLLGRASATSPQIHLDRRLNDFQRWRWSGQRQGAECRAGQAERARARGLSRQLSAKLPYALNRMIGTRFKVIPLHTDMLQAMERGETTASGGTSWEPLK